MSAILTKKLDSILEGTSRSFYLSLKQLPAGIRSQISLLYLLARTSDTITDSGQGSLEDRIDALDTFDKFAQGKTSDPPDFSILADMQKIASEGELLRSVSDVVGSLGGFSDSDQEAIRSCLGIIIGGQILDLNRFSLAEEDIASIEKNDELDDYAYRVAGSVGEFWTRMSLAHLIKLDSE